MEPLTWKEDEKPEHTFCESVYSSGLGLWCIRKTTDAGPKYGGGIDADSLCGRVKQGKGWDLEVRITEHHLKHNTCKAGLAKFKEGR
jgi:hypothetical protein